MCQDCGDVVNTIGDDIYELICQKCFSELKDNLVKCCVHKCEYFLYKSHPDFEFRKCNYCENYRCNSCYFDNAGGSYGDDDEWYCAKQCVKDGKGNEI